MPKWTDYTIKANPADKDEMMILDTAGKANKRLGLSALSDWIIGKIADKVFENLQTNNKTVLGAINELNSNTSFSLTQINAIRATGVTDIDNPPKAIISHTAVNPKGMPDINANACIIIQSNMHNPLYNAEIAFSFGSDKIAIRRKSGTKEWSDWKYFTAQ